MMECFKSLFSGGRYILVLMLMVPCWGIPEFEIMNPTLSVDNGKRQMAELSRMSNMPNDDGSCWKSALEYLQQGCKSMTEDSQVRMALRFASCFNEMLGLGPYICEPVTPSKECLKQLDESSRGTFREYFLHTQDMCYYLRQEIWQEQTNNAVTRLTDAATDVTMQMVEQKMIQEQIFTSQQESLQVQSNMKKDNEDLYQAVVKVKDVFDDFSYEEIFNYSNETAREHQLISTEIFDKLSRMQKLISWIQGEMSLLDMIFFYFGAIVFGYFATATARTRAARFWLVLLFMLSIWSEKALFKYLTQSDIAHISPEEVQNFIWVIRKIAAGCGTIIVLIAGATYRDMQIMHNNMLLKMNFALESVVQFVNDQKEQGLKPNMEPHPAMKKNNADSDDSDDTFSNYSTDESEDNLDHELKALCEDAENTENVEPGNWSLGKYFGKPKSSERSNSPAPRRYNLRERSSTPRENPVIHQESVTDFARVLKKKKASTPKPMQTPSRLNYFSSDDEEL